MKIFFSVDQPKMDKRVLERGEDAPPVSEDGLMIVCDGTGATGQSEHEISGGKYPKGIYTSAYLGSRETSRLAEKYLRENHDKIMSSFSNSNSNGEDLKSIVQDLGNTIQDGLDAFRRENHLELTVRGRSFKLLPTTFTAVVYKVCDECVEAVVLCAGDSHALWWDCEGGLRQLSSDDNGMEDGFAEGDCKINNCISANSDFCINYLCHRLPSKGILLVTSDGFTDPITFFEQERFLIKWIRDSGGFGETTESDVWELSDVISGQIDQIGFSKMDDCSLSGVIVGYQNSKELITAIEERLTFVELNYYQPFHEMKKNRRQLEKIAVDTEKKWIDAIQGGIEEFIDHADFKGTDERLQVLLSADAVQLKKQELDIEVQKEMEELHQRMDELKSKVNGQYKDFLKTLVSLQPKLKRFGGQSGRFPKDLVNALNQCGCDEEEIEKCRLKYNDSLNKLKNIQEIAKDALEVISQESKDEIQQRIKSIESLYGGMSKFLHTIQTHKEYKENEKKIEIFFGDQTKLDDFFQEDCNNNFQILSNYREEDVRSKSLYEAKTEILELKRQYDELKRQND